MGDVDYTALKATVTETNGEIACSVEETNRLRAALGLKPLKIDATDGQNKELQSVENFKRSREEGERAREAAELKERIEKSKSKRKLKTELEAATLADADGEDMDLVSAAEWVQRSRKKAELSEKERQKLAAQEAARRLDEEDELLSAPSYSSSDLKGLRVMHGANDFEAGESVILTLKDSSVLTRDENGKILGVNDDMDALENVNILEDFKRKEREERKKKASRGAYSGYDDDEFAEGVAPKTKRSILSQYDKEKGYVPKMVLSESGVEAVDQGSDEVEEKPSDRVEQNLALESKALSDYLTPAEFAKFNKPKKEKKMRKIRKKTKEEDPYAAFLESAEDTGADRGSRSSAGLGLAAVTAQEEARKREAYAEAVRQDAAKSAKLAIKTTKASVDEDAEDDLQISTALARARQVALKNRRDGEADKPLGLLNKSDITSMALKNALGSNDAEIMKSHRLPKVEAESKGDDGALDVDVDGRDATGTLYFTDTTEFTSRLQARLFERDREKADAAFKEQANKKRHRDNEEEDARAENNKSEHEMDIEGYESESDDEDDGVEDSMDVGDIFGEQKPVAAKGLAATLALLKGSGELHTKDELAGRVKDVRDSDPSAPIDEDRVKIEYRDKHGRKLTKKEAYRQLSYNFHGIEPSRKKKEKTLK
ncbi:unnamed protein product, partial [Ectocarpus fasciculatus]